jgi:anti-anti-sigma regulatory factor
VLAEAERSRPHTLLVDVREVSQISADALVELLGAGERADEDGRRVMILCDPRNPVGRLVHLTMRSRRLRLAYASAEPAAA